MALFGNGPAQLESAPAGTAPTTATVFEPTKRRAGGDVPRWLRVAIALALVAGLFFRFYHIDRKVYWDDEVFTSLHVLGLTEGDVVKRAADLTTAGALRLLLHPGPGHVHRLADTIRSLAVEDPHHTPLYYALAYEWVRLFGDATATIRMLSAVIGVLTIPCMYWLCLELFSSRRAAWIGAALLALSPVSVLYAQEAREYALWTLAILVMSATFVRAIRRTSPASWALYAAAVTGALYVFPFTLFLALGNLTLLVSTRAFSGTRQRVLAVGATAIAVVCFLPWLAVIVTNLQQIGKSMHTTTAVRESTGYILRLFFNLFRLDVLDLNLLHRAALNLLILLPILAFLGYAVAVVCRSRRLPMKMFIIAMMIFASAPFVLPDLFVSGSRTLNPRYFTPLYLALDLSLVYLFLTRLTAADGSPMRRRLWGMLFGCLLTARLVSCMVSSQATTWWNKYNEQSIHVAQVINASPDPIVMTDNFIEFTLSLANYLDDRVKLVLRPRCYQCSEVTNDAFDVAAIARAKSAGTVFLLGPSARLQNQVRGSMQASITRSYQCIDVRSNCVSELHLW